jgi:membrane protease YdiL (CAAX protease family)
MIALVVVAVGAAATKSVLIADGRWSVAAQLTLLAGVVGIAVVAIGRDAPAGDRITTVRHALGIEAPPRDRAAVLAIAVPLAISATVTVVGLVLRSEPVTVGAGDLLDLLLLVAVAEELIYRGAVLALAQRALPPIAAEAVTAVAFGLSHLGNDGGWGRVAGPILGGLAFSWLRHRTGSLAGPIAGHLATNLPGRVLAS